MSKRARRAALISGALGALQGVSDFFKTRAAQEAEMRKEERLAAIRARERSEDRAFQVAQTDRQLAAQEQRDVRQNEQLIARDERLAAAQAERDKAQGAQRMAEIAAQGKNQLAYAGAVQRPEREDTVILRDPEGKTYAMPLNDDRLREGLPPGWQMIEGRAGGRFDTQVPSQLGGGASRPGSTEIIGGQTGAQAPRPSTMKIGDRELSIPTLLKRPEEEKREQIGQGIFFTR